MGEAVATECDPFRKLELLNAQIDVLIDEEQYKKVKDKLGLSGCYNKLIDKCFNDDVCTKKAGKYWRSALSINGNKLLKAGIIQSNGLKALLDRQLDLEILKGWLALFWAKLLRARIQERNTDCYLGRLDEVVAYLERNLPPEPSATTASEGVKPDFKLYFYFLMELSAASIDHGSIGYATRAGRILKGTKDDGKGFMSFHETARRWIALNEGISYLHLRDYHKAALEFNDIIAKYDDDKRKGNKGKYYLGSNEKNLIYYPSILCRATILLKQQFSYHALQTLKRIQPRSMYKKMRKNMLVAEAYRQMERRKESAEKLKNLGEKLFQDYTFFITLDYVNRPCIPNYDKYMTKKPRSEMASFTRYVELAVNEFLEIAKCVGFSGDHIRTKFRSWVEGKLKERYHSTIDIIAEGLKDAKDMYSIMHEFLPWAENNPMDRTGYYTQMAELLAWSARILDQWQDSEEGFEKEISSQDKKRDSLSKEFSQIKAGVKELARQLVKITRELVNRMAEDGKGGKFRVDRSLP